jgi:two-component system chemotaxis sensor kinase CheA
MDLRQRLLATFRVEYSEHVSRIRDLLAGFEAAGSASPGPKLDEMFRRAHSLKGASRAVDLRGLEGLAHRMESILARVREGSLHLDPAVAQVLYRSMDVGDDLMAALSRGEAPPDLAGVLAEIDRALEADAAEPAASAEVVPIATAPSSVQPEPVTVAPESTSFAVGFDGASDTVRIPVQVLDRLLRVAGLLHVEVLHREQLRQGAEELEGQLQSLEAQWKRHRQLAEGACSADAVSHAEVLHRELTAFTRRQREVTRAFRQADWQLRQLDEQLQDEVRVARLVPAESILGGFRQMTRELARDVGKEIVFRVAGFDVQADRSVLQELKDPVMHLLRNALDHGLEETPERVRVGKACAGQLSLSLETGGGRLHLTVRDDGRGIDLEQVRATALRRGRITAEEAESMSPEELGHLIFEPGLSTARFVTDLSGRGMGLSVVSEAINRLGGAIQVLPGVPHGTQIRLTVPLAISTLPLLTVRAGGQAFGLPSSCLTRLLQVPLQELGSLEGQPTATLAGEQIPLASLAHLLGLSGAELHTEGALLPVAVVSVGGTRVGLVVDCFETHTEAVLHDLGAPFADLTHLSGGFLGERGEIVLALNPSVVVERFRHREGSAPLRIMQPERVEPESILVVDDSITTRTLEKSVLEAHGYRVRVAVDGMEALALLRQELPDLVIADVEMPRLDGFGLLEAIRKDAELRALPVIMVTSLDKREHRQKGLDLGADAYIIKQNFDQSALLETIRRLL